MPHPDRWGMARAWPRHAPRTVPKLLEQLPALPQNRRHIQIVKRQRSRRRVELLDKLREKRWTAWNTELAREIEAQAGEAYLAKWSQR
jgi:hypothetical protein